MYDKIKAEIVRLITSYIEARQFGNANMLKNLLFFIESLEEEHFRDATKMIGLDEAVELDDEIDNFLYPKGFIRKYDGVHTPGVCYRDWKGKKYVNRDVTPEDMRKYAKYFYNIGKQAGAKWMEEQLKK